jgi:23S rRNA (adenine1618-N6)-methyltransferase
MAGTDIDQHSMDYAKKNIDANGLNKRVKLVLASTDSPLIPLDKLGLSELDFVMTNPPFYASKADMQASYGSKTLPPSAICAGSDNEMIYPGGDVGFVSHIIAESLKLQDQVQWYTAMLGKLSSLQQIVAKLKEHNISNFAVTCLQAGHKTKRWAVGWSFQNYRPRNDVARHGDLVHAVLPPPTAHTIAAPLLSAEIAGERVDAALKDLDVRWQWRAAIATGVIEARENVWSRAARRKKRFGQGDAEGGDALEDESEDDDAVAIAVKVVCRVEAVEVRWLRGMDQVLFQSICGLLKRALTGRD